MHNFLTKTPFDLYDLTVFDLVVQHGSFTKAAHSLGITQSAVTRRIKTVEEKLGIPLLERTTRSVRPSPAGEFLLSEAASLVNGVQECFDRFNAEFIDGPRLIRIGISTSLCMAHLPGLFRATLKKQPALQYEIQHSSGHNLLSLLADDSIDLAILCQPKKRTRHTKVVHQFDEVFTLIGGRELGNDQNYKKSLSKPAKRKAWLQAQPWLVPNVKSSTGVQIREWLKIQGIEVKPTFTLDSFDLIINLVSIGMGVGIVPVRALATYGQRKGVIRIPSPQPLSRTLSIVTRKGRQLPKHIDEFVSDILF